MKSSTLFFSALVLSSCREQQVFDHFFLTTTKRYYMEYCPKDNSQCINQLSSSFEKCLKELDYESLELFEQSRSIDYSNSTSLPDKTQLQSLENFSHLINPCLIKYMGEGFVNNLNLKPSTIDPNITPYRTTDSFQFDTRDSGLLITIKKDGVIWINKTKTTVDQIRLIAEKHIKLNPKAHAVIIASKGSSTGDLVRVMDQLKGANINKISISSTPE